MKKNYTIILTILMFLLCTSMSAQDYTEIIRDYFKTTDVNIEDIEDLSIIDEIYTNRNDVTRVYFSQQLNGIPINNATIIASFKDGDLLYVSHSLVGDISSKAVSSTSPSLSPINAASRAATNLGLPGGDFQILNAISSQQYLLSNGGVSLENTPVKLVYELNESQNLELAWDLSILPEDAKHWWSMRINAETGTIINQNDWMISCTFPEHNHRKASNKSEVTHLKSSFQSKLSKKQEATAAFAGEQYFVYALPLESPNHGDATLVTDPQDLEASPFGWHDTDGVAGVEFSITRGNNVYAQDDLDGSNNTVGSSPDGGTDLIFNFPYNFNTNPINILNASTTNLFYWNNIIHDVFYHYGFDEASGNFQELNYLGEGSGSDSVTAQTQDSSDTNNANFATPADGTNPRMQMFLWNGPAGNPLTILNGSLVGEYSGLPANFGDSLPEDIPITGNLVLTLDDNSGGVSTDETDACDVITNGADISGNIAVLRRGECQFGFKVLAAETEGAVAVIVVNNVAGNPITMGPGDVGDQVVIPSIMINQTDGDAIIAALEAGENINAELLNGGSFQLDSSLDNGIVIHEYGHGISTRLTGGAANSNCLNGNIQAEQAGEGWSDYFALMLTMTVEDTREEGRGIATYAAGQLTDGGGIRPAPYSTDTNINSLTYGDTNNTAISQPHGIGTVWATILWDMTWDLIDEYGFDPDLYNGDGGNNTALQLVMDGLKNQPCNPGFVDGRDAILAAVDMNERWTTEEERRDAKCLVYTAFANRGVGFGASQGANASRTDQEESFEFPEGNDNFCNALSISENSVGTNFNVFPNPSNGTMTLQLSSSLGNGTVKVFDLNGRVVYNQEAVLEGSVSIQAQGLSTGVYLLQVQSDQVTETVKLIIE